MIDINELRVSAANSVRDLVMLPAEMLELIDRLEAAEKERDWHAERCEDAMNECDALRAKIEQMDAALESLLIRCDDSDSAMYGTLSTSFVRDAVHIARAALEESK